LDKFLPPADNFFYRSGAGAVHSPLPPSQVEEMKVAVVKGGDHKTASAVYALVSRSRSVKNFPVCAGKDRPAIPDKEGFTKTASCYINLSVCYDAAIFHEENTITNLKEWLL
jgi:phage/plasmid primase-like uncharacterized protein